MIFLEYLKILGTENTTGGAATCPQGWRARPPLGALPASWTPRGSPPLIPATTHSFFLPKKSLASSNPSSCSSCCHFDLLVQSSICKIVLGDCSSVCDPSNGVTPRDRCARCPPLIRCCCLVIACVSCIAYHVIMCISFAYMFVSCI